MAFQVSPGVNVSEIDLTTVVPAVATSTGAFAGVFRWGPVNEPILVNSENTLSARFGKPYANTSWQNAETFFTAANFLSYSNSLYVVRVDNGNNAIAGANSAPVEAKYPGELGNSLEALVVRGSGVEVEGTLEEFEIDVSASRSEASFDANTQINVSGDEISVGDILELEDGSRLEISDISGGTITFANRYTGIDNIGDGTSPVNITKLWKGVNFVASDPVSEDHIHVVIIDEDGEISGTPGTVLEVYENLSVNPGVKSFDGSSNYYVDVIDQSSGYVNTTDEVISTGANYFSFIGGQDGDDESNVSPGDLASGFDVFKNPDDIDVSLVLTGKSNSTIASYVIDNIVDFRKDAVAFISPEFTDTTASDIVEFRNLLPSSSYAVMDSGYKYQYDKYNDVYRWVPLNGDIAGLCARTDDQRDPWFSPAGYNRGRVKNVIKLRFNPNRSERDAIYKSGVNPVITQPGQGTVLFGDKTLLSQPSAFDRINVRRLFIVLEKAIAIASKSTLFEFNDEFTRTQFKNLVEPFLRDVEGRRGIFDFRVVCDETNNTPEVIDSNRFIGDIYIKPARSINFIQLNFVAVRTGVEFEEIVGQF